MASRDRSLLPLLAVAVALAAVVSLASVRRRTTVEAANRAVGIAVESEVVEGLAAAQGVPFGRALKNLRAQGVTHLAITEETVSTLIAEGRVTLITTSTRSSGSRTGLRFNDSSAIGRVRRGFRLRFGEAELDEFSDAQTMVLPDVSPILVRQIPIGLPPQDVAAARLAGMGVVARFGNPAGTTRRSLEGTIAWAAELGADFFLPSGDQVIGRRALLDVASEALRSRDMLYLSAEFAKIAGDAETVENAPERAIRLHTAQSAELDKIGPAGATERFVRAAKERNMRMLLVRPVSGAAAEPVTEFGAFVRSIGDGLRGAGLTVGTPRPFEDVALPKALFGILGVLGAAVAAFALAELVPSRLARTLGTGLLLLLGVGAVTKTGAQVMALVASGAFPVAGFLLAHRVVTDGRREPLGQAFLGYAIVSVVSVAGGLYVAGLLNGLPYLVKADEFRGIKVAVFVPVLVVGAYFLTKLTDVGATLRTAIVWRTAALGVVLAAVVGVMLSRTGNDGPVGASGGELAVRGLLERLLSVRPRTKEFLVGHPALLAGLALLAARFSRGRRGDDPWAGWTVLLLALGAVGQTSVVNTLCHLHIPVALSMGRIVLGLVLGAIVGVPVALVALRVARPAEVAVA